MNKSAMLTSLTITIAIALAPLICVGIYAVIRERRRVAALEANGELPFAPAVIPPPVTGFLHRFSAPERFYILRQLKTLPAGAIFCWFIFVYFSAGLLPSNVADYSSTQTLPVRVWFSYLVHVAPSTLTMTGIMFVGVAIGSAIGTAGEIVFPAPALGTFFRTRPIARDFLFWTRAGSMLLIMMGYFVIAAAASLLLVLALYGPVWKHVADSAPQLSVLLNSPDALPNPSSWDVLDSMHSGQNHLLWAMQTSLPRLLLSIATTMMLIYSFCLALLSLPFRSFRLRILVAIGFSYLCALSYIHGEAPTRRIGDVLFLYTHPGPPPPYTDALTPILLSAALLLLASFCAKRIENVR